jgi:cytochrome d ubiquinol oxidase subunit II
MEFLASLDLPFIWALIIATAVLLYVLLDGFDLGVGILFPLIREERHKDLAMNSVAPIWDGNETWLVLGGGGLFAVFPLAYATLLPALYAPLIAMLLALVFRGVAFEFRWRTKRGRWVWNVAFAGGSAIAAFSQGVALGAVLQGINVVDRAYAGGWWDWLSPFSLLTGAAVVVGYALLGATWLMLKTEGPLHDFANKVAWVTGVGTLALIGVVSLWTPFLHPQYFDRWLSFPEVLFSGVVPVLVAAMTVLLFRGLATKRDLSPFLAANGLFVLCYIGIAISLYPHIVPPSISYRDAAAPHDSLLFLLVGTSVLLPIILIYTAYAYWVFRGKLDPDEGYH